MSFLGEAFDDLDEHLTDEPNLTAIEDGEHANRMIRAIARRRRELADVEMVAQAEIQKIEEWRDAQRARLSTEGLELMLRGYHEARLADDPRAKTLRFPAGELVARARQPEWSIDDETFLDWAAVHRPECVRIRSAVDRSAVKKALRVADDGTAVDPETGERAPGVTVTPGGVSYSVKPNTGDTF